MQAVKGSIDNAIHAAPVAMYRGTQPYRDVTLESDIGNLMGDTMWWVFHRSMREELWRLEEREASL